MRPDALPNECRPDPIRVLLVDDSVVLRRGVERILAQDPDIEVAGACGDGRQAMAALESSRPDLVLLDVEMPVMDGLATLRAIRREDSRLPVLMFSHLTQRGAATTIDALSTGASDYVAKPSGTGDREQSEQLIRDQLIPKIKGLVPGRGGVAMGALSGGTAAACEIDAHGPAAIDLVAIGASTGGPKAIGEILRELPGDLRVPIVLVQHMPPLFTRLFADRLDRHCRLSVAEAGGGEVLAPGHVYVAPGDHHLRVRSVGARVETVVDRSDPVRSCRPAVDVLFRSVADTYGGRCLGVVLTGMGQDGVEGAAVLKERGARIVVQNEASSVVWGMPRLVAEAGCADRALPPREIAAQIVSWVGTAKDRAAMSRKRP